ncbi:beta-ketoacyl-[acyl-carrier-protein] synthase family protein [Stratiformator vulcanicus]|uniref:3-oxoacyl-[acyl-carrier-protein] synthase 2 n=1 Tax=Stratiformator vulcanicus TaxID=2527980 RepID=A0A517R0E8_9PLAN|nr:beta-ketoacyl-[acyl-carrier-protein] synthase family protein [Stratiformator vulcanicus]QDT37369.1 3-oxoacyl-[acyl-carrier-protein] synthase 2 [Stratiformator vulcanicus]
MSGSHSVVGSEPRRVVVSGIGVVSPIGIGVDAFWDSLAAGRSGIGYLSAFATEHLPTRLAAEVKDFDPLRLIPEKRKYLKVMSRDVQLGVAAATLAMEEAELVKGDVDPARLGVVFGAGRMSPDPSGLFRAVSACRANGSDELDLSRFGSEGLAEIEPLWLISQLPNMAACHVSIDYDAQGPNNTITCREASALLALEESVHAIRRGRADVMIVGGCGSAIHPVDIAKLSLYDSLSRRSDDPAHACRPFDFERDGTIVGESAAAFVVEDYEHARARGADIFGEILGVGSGCDGKGFANGASGMGLVRAINSAIRQAQIGPKDLGHINAHGKSTQRDDLVEARAYHRALGDSADVLPLTALKSYFGHCDSGSGAVELAGSLLAMRHGALPRTLNYDTPDPRCRLNVVHDEPYRLRTSAALTANRTSSGQSVAAVVRAV